MIPFGGWLMPVQYSGIMEEHQAVRKNVGVFDISHMGQLIVDGPGRRRMAQRDADKQRRQSSRSARGNTHFCSMNDGGIIDDLIVYRIGAEGISARRQCVANGRGFRLAARASSTRRCAALKNRSADFGGLAIQGPRIVELFHACWRTTGAAAAKSDREFRVRRDPTLDRADRLHG